MLKTVLRKLGIVLQKDVQLELDRLRANHRQEIKNIYNHSVELEEKLELENKQIQNRIDKIIIGISDDGVIHKKMDNVELPQYNEDFMGNIEFLPSGCPPVQSYFYLGGRKIDLD